MAKLKFYILNTFLSIGVPQLVFILFLMNSISWRVFYNILTPFLPFIHFEISYIRQFLIFLAKDKCSFCLLWWGSSNSYPWLMANSSAAPAMNPGRALHPLQVLLHHPAADINPYPGSKIRIISQQSWFLCCSGSWSSLLLWDTQSDTITNFPTVWAEFLNGFKLKSLQ